MTWSGRISSNPRSAPRVAIAKRRAARTEPRVLPFRCNPYLRPHCARTPIRTLTCSCCYVLVILWCGPLHPLPCVPAQLQHSRLLESISIRAIGAPSSLSRSAGGRVMVDYSQGLKDLLSALSDRANLTSSWQSKQRRSQQGDCSGGNSPTTLMQGVPPAYGIRTPTLPTHSLPCHKLSELWACAVIA